MGIMRFRNCAGIGYARVDGAEATPLRAATLIEALNGADAEGSPVARASLKPLPALDPGGKILCVALNYVDHARESAQPVPETPLLFFKAAECVIGAEDPIDPPAIADQLDYEGEIAIVIGKRGRDIAKEDALDHVAGVAPFNDVSARNLFKVKAGDGVHLDWFSGKAIDRSTPMGPEVVPIAEVRHALEDGSMRVVTKVNGEVRQDAAISDMIFDIPTLISFVSSRVTLSPGDVIATGTPPGVGAGTGRFISSGDVVRVEITGLPVLESRVA